MKRLFFILATVICLSGCANDFGAQSDGSGGETFDVEVSAKPRATRTSIDGTILSWRNDDRIAVFVDGLQYNRQFKCNDAAAGSFNGSFIKREQSKPTVEYYAYYPFVFQGVSFAATEISAMLPTQQTAPFDPSADFMIADPVSGAYDESNLSPIAFEFKTHLFSIVRITVKNTNESLKDEKLIGVNMYTPGQTLSGGFKFDVTSPDAPAVFSSDLSERVESVYPASEQPTLGLGVEHVVYLVVKPNESPITSLSLKVKTTNTVSEFTSNVDVTFAAGSVVSLPTVDLNNATQSNRIRKIVLWGDSITSDAFLNFTRQVLGSDWNVVRAGIPGDNTLGIASRQGGIQMATGNAFTIPASKNESVVINGLFSAQDSYGAAKYTRVDKEAWFVSGNCSQLNPCTIQGVECVISFDAVNNQYSLQRTADGEATSVPANSPIQTYGAKTLRDADLIVIYMGANGGGHSSYKVLCDQHKQMIDFTDRKEAIVLGFSMDISLQWGIGYWSQEYVDMFTQAFGRRFIDMRTDGSREAVKLLMRTGVISSAEEMSQADRDAVAIGDWPESFFIDSAKNVHPNTNGSYAMALLLRDRMEELGYFL